MGELLSKVIPLSLGAAISPTVLAVGLIILSGKRPIARGTMYLLGVLSILSALTALGLFGLLSAPTDSTTRQDITRVVDGISGVLLLLLAVGAVIRAYVKDPALKEVPDDDPQKNAGKDGILAPFLLGIGMMVVNFSTILLYLPAMHAIESSSVSASNKTIAVILAFFITALPATAPYAIRIFAPGVAAPAFAKLHVFINKHQHQIAIAIEVIFGAYLLSKAL